MAELMLKICVEKLDGEETDEETRNKKLPRFAPSEPSGRGLESGNVEDYNDVEPRGGGGEGGRESILDPILDFFSVVLPAVRIMFDWFLCREELCVKSALDQTLL